MREIVFAGKFCQTPWCQASPPPCLNNGERSCLNQENIVACHNFQFGKKTKLWTTFIQNFGQKIVFSFPNLSAIYHRMPLFQWRPIFATSLCITSKHHHHHSITSSSPLKRWWCDAASEMETFSQRREHLECFLLHIAQISILKLPKLCYF